jgi:hypothetical protein
VPATPAGDAITRHVVAPISMDIFEGGSGQLDIAGQVYDIHRDNNGRNWVADHLEGDAEARSFTAASPAALARAVADHHGVTGPVSIEDERPGGRATQRFEHAARATPSGLPETTNADGTIRVGGLRPGQQWVTPGGQVVANPSQRDIIQGKVTLRQPGTGPGTVPIGGTDADRRAARPRTEGESDRAYAIRTAPSREAAERLLQGNSLAGLRAIAREEGVVTASGDSKTGLVTRLMRALYDRHADSNAITEMVNRDRAPATTPGAAPAASSPMDELRTIPLANERISGREPVTATIERVQQMVASGEWSRERGANTLAQMIQRFSIDRGGSRDGEAMAIGTLLQRIVAAMRGTAPAPTMTGSQLLAQRRASRGG